MGRRLGSIVGTSSLTCHMITDHANGGGQDFEGRCLPKLIVHLIGHLCFW